MSLRTESKATSRWLLGGGAVALFVAMLLQRTGEIVFLARLDRVLDPWTSITRTFNFWDPFTDMGSLQYQTIGYLFVFDIPFGIAAAAGVPVWIFQRAMIAAVLAVAAWGFVRLLDALDIGKPVSRMVGGLAYAVSPIIIARIGWRWPEALGPALLPWILLPLVRGSTGGSTRRSAARSGVALAVVGGINGAVTLAMLPAPILYLWTREAGKRRSSLVRWCIVAAVLAVSWWLVGIVMYGRFGPDQLKLTESLSVTTQPTNLFNALRGSADWLVGLDAGNYATAASTIALRPIPIVAVGLIVGLGLAGLCDRRLVERRFFVATFVAGLILITGSTAAHLPLLTNPASSLYTAILEGPLRVFRNVHKFGALTWLPICVGLTHVVHNTTVRIQATRSRSERPKSRSGRLSGALIAGVAVTVILGGGYPLIAGTLMKSPGFENEPAPWLQAKDFLESTGNRGRVLVLPGQSEAFYRWGFTSQTPLQWEPNISSATRSQLPMSGPDAISYLDAIETAILRGGDPGLPRFLASGGFSYVLVANDVADLRTVVPDGELIADSLSRSGLSPEKQFGPARFGFGDLPQLTLWKVPASERVEIHPVSSASILSGDVESVLHLGALPNSAPVHVLATDDLTLPDSVASLRRTIGRIRRWTVTDGNTREIIDYGYARANRSGVLGESQARLDDGSGQGVLIARGSTEDQTVLSVQGLASLTASSVGSAPSTIGAPAAQPSNVLDGDLATAWYPRPFGLGSENPWGDTDPELRFVFEGRRAITTVTIEIVRGKGNYGLPVDLAVATDTDVRRVTVAPNQDSVEVSFVGIATKTLTVAVSRRSLDAGRGEVGIAEVTLPDPEPVVRLRVPDNISSGFIAEPSDRIGWVFTRRRGSASARFDIAAETRLARTMSVPRPVTVRIDASASVARPGELLDLPARSDQLRVSASSTFRDDARLAPRNLFDGDPATEWTTGERIAKSNVTSATVDVSWAEPREIRTFRVQARQGDAVPRTVIVTSGGEVRVAEIGGDGGAEIAPLWTNHVTMTLVYPAAGERIRPGVVRLHTIDIPAIADLRVTPIRLTDEVVIRCDSGLGLSVGDDDVAFEARVTLGQLVSGESFPVRSCDGNELELPAGQVTVDATNGPYGVALDQVSLESSTVASGTETTTRTMDVQQWHSNERRVSVGPGDESFLVVNEVFNRGWTATLRGERLDSVQIDGWRQGFVVPSGGGGDVVLTFAPNTPYRLGISLGLMLLAVLVVLALLPGRTSSGFGPAGERRLGRYPLLVLAAAGGLCCAGLGILALPVLVLVGRRSSRRLQMLAAAAGTGATVAAAVSTVFAPDWMPWWQVGATPTSLLAVVAVLGVIASLLSETGSPST